MARKCLLARQAKREKLVEKYAALRKELKENGDYEALQKLPKILLKLDCIIGV